jgi:hypothetical protein
MRLNEHLNSKSLREYVIGSLRPESESEVSLHLSICRLCQDSLDMVLLDVAFRGRERQSGAAVGHFGDEEFRKYWAGPPQDQQRVEEISQHCLHCRPCRDRRHRAWQEMRESAAHTPARAAAAVRLVLAVFAVVRRRRRPAWAVLAVSAGLCLMALVYSQLRGVNQVSTSLSVRRQKNVEPATNQILNLPPAVPDPTLAPTPRSDKSTPAANPPSRTDHPVETYEQSAQHQSVDLRNDPGTAYFRGADGEEGQTSGGRKIFISRRGRTRLEVSLPEGGRSGTYRVYLQEPARLSTLAEGSGFSADGARLSISLDARRLAPGGYVLCVTRLDEKTGAEEYLGHYAIRAFVRNAKGRARVK